MKTKTKIEKQLRKKSGSVLVETIIAAKKLKGWMEIASLLSRPTREKSQINLDKINSEAKTGETIVVPGKILSLGVLDKKIKIVGLGASEKALEKIKNAKGEFILLKNEIKSNPEAKGVKIIK